jgi:hypothetical protein
MRNPVYNSSTPPMKLAYRVLPVAAYSHAVLCAVFLLFFPLHVLSAATATWSAPEQQLAAKIVAVTGPGAAALTIDNRSSLSKRDLDIIGNGLRSALEALGVRFVAVEQASATLVVTFSENQSSYVWVADIHQAAAESAIVMISIPQADLPSTPRDSVPLSLKMVSLWKQSERILDTAVLEENINPTRIAVLASEQLTLYRWQGAKWKQEQSLPIVHAQPWPRDVRGRLLPAKDHLLDIYLPGVLCHTTSTVPLALNCRESDDPWPLAGPSLNTVAGFGVDSSKEVRESASSSVPSLSGFYAPARNFFTGVVSPRVGKFSTAPKFYSLAFVPRDKYVLWLFAAVDGQVHIIDGVSDLTIKAGFDKTAWGSNLASIRSSCGVGWQVLAVNSRDGDKNQDSIRAYEFPDRDPVAVSSALAITGEVTALWTEPKGENTIVVVQHQETGDYEAFRLAVACSQ